jgi:hypothetical protein
MIQRLLLFTEYRIFFHGVVSFAWDSAWRAGCCAAPWAASPAGRRVRRRLAALALERSMPHAVCCSFRTPPCAPPLSLFSCMLPVSVSALSLLWRRLPWPLGQRAAAAAYPLHPPVLVHARHHRWAEPDDGAGRQRLQGQLVSSARKVLDAEMPVRDVATWNTLLTQARS